MPLTRYQIRSEYGLADPELYRAADRDDPEALLEGVAMAGLVGVLRQLGDLAEFAAEIFHDLHEEVMATATRGHSLMIRVHQLEADFPTIEKALLSQTNHSSFFSNAGVDWRPNLRSEQNLITRGDMPRFVMDSYEECRGPPRLFLLDKFDVAGAGACLKRYTDPSFFKAESASSGIAVVEMQREKKLRKVKKKGSRWRNGETPDVSLTSHTKLHELFLEERVANGYSDSKRLVKLKKRHLNASAVDSKTGKSYMEKFLETPSPERKLVCETSVTPAPLKLTSDNISESGLRMLDISIVSPAEKSPERRSSSSSPNAQEVILKPSVDGFNGGIFDREIAMVSELDSDGERDKSYSNLSMVAVEKQLAVDGEGKNEGSLEGYNSDDVTSEVDNYVDALPSMESEMETDNEYRPKNNLPFLNVGKYGTDSDPSEEEHMELQAHFLDSQSIGNSSTSDDMNNSYKKDGASFSHSDNLSNLVENTPSDCNGAAKEFPSTETCGAEIFGVPSDQPSVIVESLEATSNEHVVLHDKCIEEDMIPINGDTSCSTFVREMSPTHSYSGASSHEVSLVGPVLDETPHGKIKVGSESSDINENGTNLDDPMADVPGDSCQTKDELKSTAIHPVDESDVQELGVISDALAHFSNVSELASEDQSGNNSVNEVFQAQCADEDSMKSLASRKIDSPCLSISPTEEQLFSSALPEVQTYSGDRSLPYYSDVANPDTMVSKPDDPVAPTAVNSEVIPLAVDTAWSHCSEELYPVVDAPQTRGLIEMQDAPQMHGLMEQEFSHLNEDVPQHESISAEAGIPHYEEKFSGEEISRTVDDDDEEKFTSDVDAEGGDAVSVELPSYCPGYPGHEDHVNSDVVPETVHVQSVAVSSAAVAKTDDDVNDVSPDTIPSPSRNFENLHESLSDVRDLNQKESELDDVVSPECVTDSEAQKEVSKLEVVSPDSESNPYNSVTYDHSRSEVSDEWDDVVSPECVRDSETQKEVSKLEVVSPDSESNPNNSVTYDHSHSEVSGDGHDFSLDDQTEKSLAVCDITTASTSLILSNHESESQSLDQSHMEDVASSSTCYLPEPETSLENLLELQADQVDTEYLQRDGASDQPEPAIERSLEFKSDQLDAECSQEDQATVSSNLQSAQIGSANHMDKETSKQLPSTEHINQEICLDTSSGSCPENFRSQPSTSEFLPESGQELDVMKQTMEPLQSIHPSFVLLPEAAVVNLEDMPPLPPLPPMQWRMGKIQHASLASQGEFVGVSQDGFLPIGPIQPSKADEKAPFDVPAPQGGVLQLQNPFLALTSVEDAKSEHVSEPLGGNVVLPASYSLQLPTMVNDANYQYSFPDLGGMQFSNPFLSLYEVSDDRSGHNDLALEGEKVQSSSKPFSVPGSECTTSNQDPVFSHGAIIQPVQQLTPETGLEPMVLKHSLENSEWEQGKPLTASVAAPTIVDEQPQLSLPTLEGEIAWSSNTSAVMADSDVGKSNGNPVSKVPRPRNPLIDAVAAHGQSKLRKVTERARPQIEPKVDERDSLLEQIRAKSFNLKPATVTRPSIQGPKTNLKVAAILAKANSIRQALAGSDEDDDEDRWSDS